VPTSSEQKRNFPEWLARDASRNSQSTSVILAEVFLLCLLQDASPPRLGIVDWSCAKWSLPTSCSRLQLAPGWAAWRRSSGPGTGRPTIRPSLPMRKSVGAAGNAWRRRAGRAHRDRPAFPGSYIADSVTVHRLARFISVGDRISPSSPCSASVPLFFYDLDVEALRHRITPRCALHSSDHANLAGSHTIENGAAETSSITTAILCSTPRPRSRSTESTCVQSSPWRNRATRRPSGLRRTQPGAGNDFQGFVHSGHFASF